MFELTDDQRMLKDMIREFCEKEIAPHAKAWDEAEETPTDVIHKLADLGLWGMQIPEEYGGAGLPFPSFMIAVEELSRWSASVAIAVCVHNSVGSGPLLLYGSDEQKARFLPELATSKLACFCLTEPNAGSDAGALLSTAVLEGDTYVLNGVKIYVTNGDIADYFMVFAKTDPDAGKKGISAFILDRDTPGLSLGTKEKKMGLKASGTMEVLLEDAEVPADRLVGPEGRGFRVALSSLDGGRIGVGAQAHGVARAAYEEARRYVTEREAFGRTLAHFQGIQWKLADMALQMDAAWLLIMRAAHLKDAGHRVTKEAAMAKLHASEMAQRVASEALQIHGGYGYIRDYAVERYYRDARVMALYEGTSEIQRHVIARELLRD